MKDALTTQPEIARRIPKAARKRAARRELPEVRARILGRSSEVRILDPSLVQDFIHRRQEADHDKYDEMWEGVYVVPALPRLPHQRLVGAFCTIFYLVITSENRGTVQPGANVSDREEDWEADYRAPDVVVVLNDGRAVDCGTHWMGGPDFLTEVLSPRDPVEEKIPFYGQLQVRELLVVHPETRHMQLYRHDGQQLVLVAPTAFQGGRWLVSEVLPLAFRRRALQRGPQTEIRRTDGKPGHWTV